MAIDELKKDIEIFMYKVAVNYNFRNNMGYAIKCICESSFENCCKVCKLKGNLNSYYICYELCPIRYKYVLCTAVFK